MNRYAVAFLDIALILIISFLLFVAFIGSYHLIIPDEGRYSEVVREMLASGNWVTPHLDGVVFLDKPILMYWLEGFSMKFFGINEFAARFVPVCLATLGVLLTYCAGRQLYNRSTAIISSFVLMTSMLYFMSAHYVDMDLAVAVFLSGALWFFIMAMNAREGLPKKSFLWVAYVFAGLAVLTKGLMGIVFPIMIIGMWVILLNEWRQVKRMCLISGLAIFFIIVLPWYIDVQIHNPDFFHYFFIYQQFERYIGSGYNMHNPLYFYFLVIIAGMLPWTIFMWQSLVYAVKDVMKKWRGAKNEMFLLLWVILITVFFTVPRSKIVGYILPVFPPLAMLIGHYLSDHWNQLSEMKSFRRALSVLGVIAIGGVVGIVVVSFMPSLTDDHSRRYLFSMAAIMLVAVYLCWRERKNKKNFARTFYLLLTATVAMALTATAGVATFQLKNEKSVGVLIRHLYKPGDKIVGYYHYSQDLPFYMRHKMYVVLWYWQDPNLRKKDNWRGELARGLKDTPNEKYLINEKVLKKWWKEPTRLLVITQKYRAGMLAKSMGAPFYMIANYGRIIVVSNKPGIPQQKNLKPIV